MEYTTLTFPEIFYTMVFIVVTVTVVIVNAVAVS